MRVLVRDFPVVIVSIAKDRKTFRFFVEELVRQASSSGWVEFLGWNIHSQWFWIKLRASDDVAARVGEASKHQRSVTIHTHDGVVIDTRGGTNAQFEAFLALLRQHKNVERVEEIGLGGAAVLPVKGVNFDKLKRAVEEVAR